jgi:uncharacterized protein
MMFVLGLLALRLRVFQEPGRHRKLLITIIVYGAAAGVASFLIGRFWHPQFSRLRLGLACRTLLFTFFDERFQGLAYAAALLLWMSCANVSHRITGLLAAPGRLSLTNYVMQIAILEGLFGLKTPLIPLNRWGALAGVLFVFSGQIWLSRWWMTRYRYGPLEWLWRSVTLARWEPLRRGQSRAAAA